MPALGRVAAVPPLVGVPEIAERLGVDKRTVHRWRGRDDFPTPLERLASGPVWDWPDVDQWATDVLPTIRPGRPKKQS